MIGMLSGVIKYTFEKHIILDVNGVGYVVYVPAYLMNTLHNNDVVTLFIETIVREDSITLYGFSDVDSQILFNTLTSVNGVGAKAGMEILNIGSSADLINAIISSDIAFITQANGIGKKIATRVVHELADKVAKMSISANISASLENVDTSQKAMANDAILALINLGYGRKESAQATKQILNENPDIDVSGLITKSLHLLSSQ